MSAADGDIKTCRACGETKPIGDFRKRSHRDGRRTICRPCEATERRHQKLRTPKPPKPLASFLVGPEAWKDQAACADGDLHKFFPKRGQSGGIAAIKKICAKCPVRDDCLAYDQKVGVQPGIWGGLTETERWKLRKEQQKRGATA